MNRPIEALAERHPLLFALAIFAFRGFVAYANEHKCSSFTVPHVGFTSLDTAKEMAENCSAEQAALIEKAMKEYSDSTTQKG